MQTMNRNDIAAREGQRELMTTKEMLRVLVVEDEEDIREFLVGQFAESGADVRGMASGEGIRAILDSFKPDVVLMDQMMPGKSGKELVTEIRGSTAHSQIPIMMVTSLDGEQEKIDALEIGADDYVTKPFSIREVIARAHALVRRTRVQNSSPQKTISYGDLQIDLSAHRVTMAGAELALTLTEFKILVELLRHAGQVLSRDKLREKALGNLNVTDRTIDVHMASLRKKLGAMGDQIDTVRGVGYRMAN